jgi:hypothetical protein
VAMPTLYGKPWPYHRRSVAGLVVASRNPRLRRSGSLDSGWSGKHRHCGECRYERPADRASSSSSSCCHAGRFCDARIAYPASRWLPNSASTNTPLASGAAAF